MDRYEGQVNGKPIVYTSQGIVYGNVSVPFEKMESIEIVEGPSPSWQFVMNGRRMQVPYSEAERGIVESFLQNAIKDADMNELMDAFGVASTPTQPAQPAQPQIQPQAPYTDRQMPGQTPDAQYTTMQQGQGQPTYGQNPQGQQPQQYAGKTVVCKSCGAVIPKGIKICPNCGAKQKKPIYKRAWFIILVILALLLIAGMAFGGGGDSTSEDGTQSDTNATTEKKEAKENKDVLFKDGVYEDDDIRIEIKKYEVIQPGDTTYSEYSIEEEPVIAFWYEVTNKSGEEVDPSTAWIMNFTAIQDNDPNRVNELEISSLPDEKYLDTQMENIKKGGTVENCEGYVLDDTETPVKLQVTEVITGKDLGSQTFEIK